MSFFKNMMRGFLPVTLAVLLTAGLLICERNAVAAGYGTDQRLLSVVPDGNIIEIEAAGRRCMLDITLLKKAENLRREYYAFLPRSLRITEQAVNLCLKGLFQIPISLAEK